MVDFPGIPPGLAGSVRIVAKGIERFRNREEVTNLFRDLRKHYQDDPALFAAFDALRLDFEFMIVLREHLEDPSEIDRGSMVAAVRHHVADRAGRTRDQWASAIADTIIRLVPKALSLAQQDQHPQHERTRGRLEDLVAPELFFTDWAPESLQDGLRDLSNQCPAAAGRLGRELGGEERPGPIVSGLISRPPAWAQEACAATWDLLSRFAETHGDFSAARSALERTEPDGRVALRATRRARLAMLAYLDGDGDEYHAHLAAAREANAAEPAIALAVALPLDDPADRLEALAGVSASEKLVEAAIAATRAEALLQLHKVGDARGEAARALGLAPRSLRTREIDALVEFFAALLAITIGEPVDRAQLRRAAVALESLADQLHELDRVSEEAMLLSRAAVARALGEDHDEAARLLARALANRADLSAEARLQIAEAAMAADRPVHAREALAGVAATDDRARVILAAVALQVDADENAVEELDYLLGSTAPAVRERAARERLMATAAVGAPWSNSAAEVVEEDDPALVAVVRSMLLERQGDPASALETLGGHLNRPRVRMHAAGLMARSGKLPEAIQLLEPIAGSGAPPSDRLRLAYFLDQDERYAEALTIAAELRSDRELPLVVRNEAYAMSFLVLGHRDDAGAQERLAREWVALEADDERAPWGHAEALARLGHFPQAVGLIDELGLSPDTIRRAYLLATSLLWTEDRPAAVTRLVGLSDAFGGVDERLEAYVLIGSLGTPADELAPGVGERVQRLWTEFPERFPESTILRAIQLGDDPAKAIAAFLGQHPGPDPARVAAFLGAVELALAPVAAIAAVGHIGLSAAWSRLDFLPVGEPVPELAQLERQAAATALDAPAVVEISAVYVADGIGGAASGTVWEALPGAVCGQSTRTEAIAGRPLPSESEGRAEGTLRLNADEELVIQPWDEEFADRQARSGAGVADRVAGLAVALEVDPESQHPDDLALRMDPAPPEPLVASFGAINLARRRRLPLYSDDLFVRRRARALGVPTFGTLALMDALVDRERLSAEEREWARRRLIDTGALGVSVDAEELVELARLADFDITSRLTTLIQDRSAWAAGPTDVIYRWLPLLRAAWREAPERLEKWVLRLAVAGQRALPLLTLNEWTAMMSTVVWQPWGGEEPEFVAAFLRAARGIQRWGWPDPLPGALAFIADYAEERGGPALRTKVLAMAAWRLPASEALNVIFGGLVPGAGSGSSV